MSIELSLSSVENMLPAGIVMSRTLKYIERASIEEEALSIIAVVSFCFCLSAVKVGI